MLYFTIFSPFFVHIQYYNVNINTRFLNPGGYSFPSLPTSIPKSESLRQDLKKSESYFIFRPRLILNKLILL